MMQRLHTWLAERPRARRAVGLALFVTVALALLWLSLLVKSFYGEPLGGDGMLLWLVLAYGVPRALGIDRMMLAR